MGLKVKAIERNVSFVKDGDPMIPITEMAVVGVTTAIRQLLAEAGGGGKHGLPHAPDFREMIISSRSGR